ncbi:MAG: aminoglycoside phosphotransferase family protein [Gemmatimonadetes bacterium]|nr:aminoglycoside phosphotransferase family protein [Gemmatimonadota bacterium]
MIAAAAELRAALEATKPPAPGAEDLWDALQQARGGAQVRVLGLERLESRVYRVITEAEGTVRPVVAKQLDPGVAWRGKLVLDRWLPTMGLADRRPRLLVAAASRQGEWVWHVYEDLGDHALNGDLAERSRVEAAVEAMADLHRRTARHPLLPECRYHGGDRGAAYFATSLRDAVHGLELLRPTRIALSTEQITLRDRLLDRLQPLLDDHVRRARVLAEQGGPDVLLHGDLRTVNVIVTETAGSWYARLVGWGHAGVGPIYYDLSAFLYRFPRRDRPWILDAYRAAVERGGWRLPGTRELNLMLETTEYARQAGRIVWPTVALLVDGAQAAFAELAAIERRFESLEPALPSSGKS